MAKVIKAQKTRKQKTKAQVGIWLKGKGYKHADVDREMTKDLKEGLRGLMQVTLDEYRAAGGQL